MKKINFSFSSIFMLLVCVFSVQSVFSIQVPLKKSENGAGTSTFMTKSVSAVPVFVDVNDTELGILFNKSVGVVRITVEDQSGSVVYQDILNTNSTRALNIETGGFDSGNYTVKISYGSTNLVGAFQL